MKKIINILIIVLFLASCEEIIEIKLDPLDSILMIEANYNITSNMAEVKLSKTISINESNQFPEVSNAIVSISDELQNTYTLSEIKNGIYKSDSIRFKAGEKLKLTVIYDNKSYTSILNVPKFVKFDSLVVRDAKITGMGPKGNGINYDVIVIFQDPPNELNYYRFVEIINGVPVNNNFVYDNKISDGNKAEIKLMRRGRKLEIGDTLEIEMQCIDKSAYEYFKSFGSTMGGPMNATTPANPKTNINGNSIGYFNIHTSEKKIFIINK